VPQTRVLVVVESDLVRAGLVALLEREPDLEVVGEAATLLEGLEIATLHDPEVAVLDLDNPGMRGAAACAEIAGRFPHVRVVMLGACLEDTVVHACLRAGARGYLPRDACGAEIAAAVRAVARGEAALAHTVINRLVDWARRTPQVEIDADSLGTREVLTLSLVAQGMKNREIGRRLGVSEGTAKLVLRSAMRKLGVRERSQAVAAGLRRGVI
jgi:DNA-binding NarL/FixJ family response regulator